MNPDELSKAKNIATDIVYEMGRRNGGNGDDSRKLILAEAFLELCEAHKNCEGYSMSHAITIDGLRRDNDYLKKALARLAEEAEKTLRL